MARLVVDRQILIPAVPLLAWMPSGAVPKSTAAGSVVNGSFGGNAQSMRVGEGWTALASSDYRATFAVTTGRVHGGAKSRRGISPQQSATDHFSGVYQRLTLNAGECYLGRACNRTHFTGGIARS